MKTLLSLVLTTVALCVSTLAIADRQASDDERHIDDPRVQHRSYEFPSTGESIPYAVFVPSSYDASRPTPLIVSLHGLGDLPQLGVDILAGKVKGRAVIDVNA